MSLTFGTDGVRGDARTDLTEGSVRTLGRAGAEVLGADGFAVGRDPRLSGPALAEALMSGVAAAGGEPVDLGVVPTPAVALWCADRGVAGAMVSASHNPWHDNGVKLFAAGGHKLAPTAETDIERRFAQLTDAEQPAEATQAAAPAEPRAPRTRSRRSAGAEATLRHSASVAASIQGRDLTGLRVVADCANGAASGYGPDCLRRLGAEVETIHASPDGRNINRGCGSLHPADLQVAVVAHGADAGVAFDGDADRVLAVDHTGALIDGDRILAVCAIDRHSRGRLDGGAVVITVMANLGLRRAMAERGIGVVETAVGDRNVLDALTEHGLTLGGEQSGHLIFRDLATTGDGLLTAVQLLDTVKRSRRRLADLAAAVTCLPQVLLGVPVPERMPVGDIDAVLAPAAGAAAARLAATGRVLVRASGTEPVVRVMVEARDEITARAEAERAAADIAAALQ